MGIASGCRCLHYCLWEVFGQIFVCCLVFSFYYCYSDAWHFFFIWHNFVSLSLSVFTCFTPWHMECMAICQVQKEGWCMVCDGWNPGISRCTGGSTLPFKTSAWTCLVTVMSCLYISSDECSVWPQCVLFPLVEEINMHISNVGFCLEIPMNLVLNL